MIDGGGSGGGFDESGAAGVEALSTLSSEASGTPSTSARILPLKDSSRVVSIDLLW
jgi:hypothetical protein